MSEKMVRIKAIGMTGKVGEQCGRQFRVTFPDGRWGWHYPHEWEEVSGFDFQAAEKQFGENVMTENRLTCKAFNGPDVESESPGDERDAEDAREELDTELFHQNLMAELGPRFR